MQYRHQHRPQTDRIYTGLGTQNHLSVIYIMYIEKAKIGVGTHDLVFVIYP